MSRKIRVLHIISSLNPGGAELMIRNLSESLIPRGFEFHVISMFSSCSLKESFEERGITVSTVEVEKRNPIGKLLKCRELIKKFKPDIVHSHTEVADQWGLPAAYLAGVKIRITTAHNTPATLSPSVKKIWQRAGKLCEKVVIVAESSRVYYEKHKLYPPEKMVVVHNAPGFNSEDSTPKRFPESKQLKLIQCARYTEQKGQSFLLKALEQTPEIPLKLEIYGADGGLLEQLSSEAGNMVSSGRVELNPPSSEVIKLLNSSHIYMATSLWESFHMSLLEAMSCGVVPIVTDLPAHRELLSSIDNYPLFVPAGDSIAIETALRFISERPKLYEELSLAVIEASKRFSLKNMVDGYENVYRTTLKKG